MVQLLSIVCSGRYSFVFFFDVVFLVFLVVFANYGRIFASCFARERQCDIASFTSLVAAEL
jgi:hypothetical protein